MRARDATLASLEIPFRCEHDSADTADGRWFVDGRFFQSPTAIAVERWIGWEGKGARLERAVFDGTELRSLGSDESGRRPVLTIRAELAEPFSTYSPANFGLRHLNRPWPDVLEGGGLVQALGREEVAGRDCLRVLLDEAPGDDGEYSRPVLLWIDTHETLLVLRSQTHLLFDGYASLRSTPEAAERVAVEWGRRRFIPYVRWEVEEVAEFQPGLWIAVRGRQSLPAAPHLSDVLMTADSAGIRSGHAIPDSVFQLEIEPGTHVDDHSTGLQSHLVGEDGSTGDDATFEEVLARFARPGAAPHAREPQPWETSSCGPNALYFVLRRLGSDVGLAEVLGALPDFEQERTSLAALRSAAGRLGFEARAVEMTTEALREHGASGNLIAQVLEPDGVTGHFAVVWLHDDGVELISPPEPPERISTEELARLWTGKALLVTPSSARPSARAWVRTALLAGSALLAGAALIAWRARSRTAP